MTKRREEDNDEDEDGQTCDDGEGGVRCQAHTAAASVTQGVLACLCCSDENRASQDRKSASCRQETADPAQTHTHTLLAQCYSGSVHTKN